MEELHLRSQRLAWRIAGIETSVALARSIGIGGGSNGSNVCGDKEVKKFVKFVKFVNMTHMLCLNLYNI